MPSQNYDVAIIGAGIVGLATAYRLSQQFPQRRVLVLEKEAEVAQHQSGHNSGVLHSGIYYAPGSLKAVNCRRGKEAMQQFCQEQGIPFQLCGKVIVATCQEEVPRLERIFDRGQKNGVRCRWIEQGELAELEPSAAGLSAVHVPEAGIVDFRQVCRRLAELVRNAGGTLVFGARVRQVRPGRTGNILETTAGAFQAELVVNCGGLQSDRLARRMGQKPPARIIPFRGEFYRLRPEAHHLCRGLIYPVPDPNFPFLGVHLTRTIHGGVECGPNAVLSLAREGYHRLALSPRDALASLTYPGFLRMAGRYWRTGLEEMWRSLSKRAFLRALQRLVPELSADDLLPAPCGIRAQAVLVDGTMVDDFLIVESQRAIHVSNAPSPAATSSLNIGSLVVERLARRWEVGSEQHASTASGQVR